MRGTTLKRLLESDRELLKHVEGWHVERLRWWLEERGDLEAVGEWAALLEWVMCVGGGGEVVRRSCQTV